MEVWEFIVGWKDGEWMYVDEGVGDFDGNGEVTGR